MKKSLYIISGCNGAGKTTASYSVLPKILHCKEFVNADEIARGLSPFNPENFDARQHHRTAASVVAGLSSVAAL